MPKKTPMRRCVGCMEMKEKTSLVRVVKNKEGEISLDLTGKMPGRGAYLCKNEDCLKKARKARRLEREFSMAVPAELYDRMEADLKNDEFADP